jgi:hypothetical protein
MKAAQTKDQYLDCVAMKRRIQQEIAAETRGMTPRQRLAYYKKLADESPFATMVRRRNPGRRSVSNR